MTDYLNIQARLPLAAGLELSARLLAARPAWDIEVEDDGLYFKVSLPDAPQPVECLTPDAAPVSEDLELIEEACQGVERARTGFAVELSTTIGDPRPHSLPPGAAGPWSLEPSASGLPGPDRLILPAQAQASRRFWATESLLLTLMAEHLTPPPGAPETRGLPTLVLGTVLPLAPTVALWSGLAPGILSEASTATNSPTLPPERTEPLAPVFLLGPPEALIAAQAVANANGLAGALNTIEQPFPVFAKKQTGWEGHFGLIALNMSPYLISRWLKTLARWLNTEGALIISGFAPGPQTAHLLRAAAKAGLHLSGTIIDGYWAAMKLRIAPARPQLPPLTGSVVPDLVDLPEKPVLEEGIEEEEEEIPDEDSLMVDEAELDDEEL